jgi:hypothetical protein
MSDDLTAELLDAGERADLRAELLGGWEFLDDRHKLLLVAAAHRLAIDQKKAAAADD